MKFMQIKLVWTWLDNWFLRGITVDNQSIVMDLIGIYICNPTQNLCDPIILESDFFRMKAL